MSNYKKILLCTDFSDASVKSLNKALSIAQAFSADFLICHVVSPIASIPVNGYYYPLDIELEKNVMDEAKKKMQSVTQELNIKKENIHVFFGDPKESIVSFAKEQKTDLIIVAGHHHSFLGMLGSTANYITNKSVCDILIINS